MSTLERVGWLSSDRKFWRPCGNCLHLLQASLKKDSILPKKQDKGLCPDCQSIPPDVLVNSLTGWRSRYNPRLHGVIN
jgi:hypothetical protein